MEYYYSGADRPRWNITTQERKVCDVEIEIILFVVVGKRKRKRPDSALWEEPLHRQKIQKATWQHKNATKNFDYTTIADRLLTVSWGNDSHPTGVVKPVLRDPNLPTNHKSRVIKKTHLKVCK